MREYWIEYTPEERPVVYQSFISRAYLRHVNLTDPGRRQDGLDPLSLGTAERFAAAATDRSELRLVRVAILHAMLTTLDWMKKDAFLSGLETGKDMVLQTVLAEGDTLPDLFNRMAAFQQDVEFKAYEP